MTSLNRQGRRSVPMQIGGAVTMVLGLALGGCASKPDAPKSELAVSQAAIDSATTAGATEHAPLELNQARQKLDAARTALRAEEHEKARRLAEQAEVDARVAAAKANAEKSRRAVTEIEQSIRMLREEMQRSGTRPAS